MIISNVVLISKKGNKLLGRYKKLGYDVSKDFFEVNINDLSNGSKAKIDVQCEYCLNIKNISYNDYNKSTNNKTLKYACKNCSAIKQKENMLEKWGIENIFQREDIKDIIKETNLIKYGVTSYSKTNEFKEKVKKTNMEKYGFDNPTKSNKIKFKIKSTNIERYGFDHPMKSSSVQNKSKSTNLDKYNVEYVFQNTEIKEKIKNSNIERYGGIGFQSKEICSKSKKTNIEKYGFEIVSKNENFRKNNFSISNDSNYIGYIDNSISIFRCDLNKEHKFEISSINYHSRKKSNLPLCTICNPIGDLVSIKEEELYEFIKSNYNGNIIQSYRDGLEIDIYLPELKIGFEFNGLYWHSTQFKDKNYHINKTNYFKERGIRIIHIWEDDWTFKRDIIKSQIKYWIGVFDKNIGARKCQINVISDIKIVKDFLNKNHIQGYVRSSIKIGLYYNNELVSIMCFDQSEGRKKMKDGEWNLSRFCNKLNTNMVGGASKLLKYFIIINNPKRIISYADMDWSIGNLYKKLGFDKLYNTNPDYKYVLDSKRIHKSRFRKSITNISESQLNIPKIFDCGKVKFEKLLY